MRLSPHGVVIASPRSRENKMTRCGSGKLVFRFVLMGKDGYWIRYRVKLGPTKQTADGIAKACPSGGLEDNAQYRLSARVLASTPHRMAVASWDCVSIVIVWSKQLQLCSRGSRGEAG